MTGYRYQVAECSAGGMWMVLDMHAKPVDGQYPVADTALSRAQARAIARRLNAELRSKPLPELWTNDER